MEFVEETVNLNDNIEEDNTPNFEIESIDSNENFELEDEIENDLQNKMMGEHFSNSSNKKQKKDDIDLFGDDDINFSNFVSEPKTTNSTNNSMYYFERFMNNRNGYLTHNNYYDNNPYYSRDLINSSYYGKKKEPETKKNFTKEEIDEIFNKIEDKDAKFNPDCDEVFNNYLNNYTLKKNIKIEIEFTININEKEQNSILEEFDNINYDDFYKKNIPNKRSNLTPIYNFMKEQKKEEQNQEPKLLNQTQFDFFKYKNFESSDYENDDFDLFDDSIKIPEKENIKSTSNSDEEDDNDNYSVRNCGTKKSDKFDSKGEISEIFNKTFLYFNSSSFTENDLIPDYNFIFENCKPGEEYYETIERCLDNMYFEKYFYEYFSNNFFQSVYKRKSGNYVKKDDESESELYEIDKSLFNICLMNLVNKNIDVNHILTRDLFAAYVYVFSFIEDVICHYYYHLEYDIKDISLHTYESLSKLISNEKREYYLDNKSIPSRYLMFLSIWIFALNRMDIYPNKESIIMNIYHLDFIFEDIINFEESDDENYCYDSEPEPDFNELEDENKDIDPNMDNMQFVNNNYQINFDSFSL